MVTDFVVSRLPSYEVIKPSGIPGAILCFCTGSYAAAAGRRYLFTRITLEQLFRFLSFWHDCWPWPIDYLIRFWSIFVVTLTMNFQDQLRNLLYFSQKWPDCHETKIKHIAWTLGLKCDQWVWPWPWPWPLNFQGQMWPWPLTTCMALTKDFHSQILK